MGYVAGVGGPVPAMALLGREFPGLGADALGAGGSRSSASSPRRLLRRKLVVDEALPFPTGNATGDLIETIFAARASARAPRAVPARRRGGGGARDLVPRRAAAADPQHHRLRRRDRRRVPRGAHRRNELEPAPALDRRHDGDPRRGSAWRSARLSPGWASPPGWSAPHRRGGRFRGLLLLAGLAGAGAAAGGELPAADPRLALDRPLGERSRRAGAPARRRQAGRARAARRPPGRRPSGFRRWRWRWSRSPPSGAAVFGLHPLALLVAVVAALVLAVVSSRATGETDLAPVGPVGTLTQLLFAGYGPILSILAGSISMGTRRRRRRRSGRSRRESGCAGRRARSWRRSCWGR